MIKLIAPERMLTMNNVVFSGVMNTSDSRADVFSITFDSPSKSILDIDEFSIGILSNRQKDIAKFLLQAKEGEIFLNVECLSKEFPLESFFGITLSAIMNCFQIKRLWITDENVTKSIEEYFILGNYPELSVIDDVINGTISSLVQYFPEKIMITYRDSSFNYLGENNFSILDAALSRNVEIKHMCKSGVCLKCRLNLLSGACISTSPSVGTRSMPTFQILACDYRPITSIKIG